VKKLRDMKLLPVADRGPLRVMFAVTSMPVGGAETLLVNLVRRLDRTRFLPEIVCLKAPGPLGQMLASELTVHTHVLRNKYDVGVLRRLRRLIRQQRIDALITVGAGDKMFWGRLAAWLEHTPVVCSALHSTGWPDSIGFLNRRLTGITDSFIAVAEHHGRYLVEHEHLPAAKVNVIPNGIDTDVFRPLPEERRPLREELGISDNAPVAAIVAALRPEKNHVLFLEAAVRVRRQLPNAQFLIVGDGPERQWIETVAHSLRLGGCIHFLGTRADIARVLAGVDVFVLTSHNEANPVSILEALACCVPVVSTRVGSVHQSVIPDKTGYLVDSGDASELAARVSELLAKPLLRRQLGAVGRSLVENTSSLSRMVEGYQELITKIYEQKVRGDQVGAAASGIDEPLATTYWSS
jgi:glycosyltransferase involved in cell wall biosynthesis